MPFRKSDIPELTQTEREAIVDLLHYSLYADSHIALKEGELLSELVGVIGWDVASAFQTYEAKSVAAAREAGENAEARKIFLDSISERLQSPGARALAVDLSEQLIASDGTVEKESSLIAEIRALLK
jgi:hypothetical protein